MAQNHEFDFDTWMSGLDLPAETRATIAESLKGNAKNVEYIKASQLRHQDYSFKMNQVGEKEKELAEKLRQEEEYVASLDAWKAEQENKVGHTTAEFAKAKGEAQALRAYLEANGIDPKTVLPEGLTVAPAAPLTPVTVTPDAPAIDTAKFLTREQGLALARWPVVYDQLNRQHQQLFGTAMDGEKLYTEVMKGQETPEAVFNRVFNVDARRAEIAVQERKDWEGKTRNEIKMQVLSEIQAGKFAPTNALGDTAPVIKQFGVQGQTSNDNIGSIAAQDYLTRQRQREAGSPVFGGS